MFRFALAVTVVELALTTTAALLLAGSIEGDLYLGSGEIAALGLPVESHSRTVVRRFQAVFSHDTSASSGNAGLWISVRPGPIPADYTVRRLRESGWVRKAGPGSLLMDEDGPDERGYASRHLGGRHVRSEVVRYRPEAMLIVRVWERDAGSRPDEAAARCERRARLVAERMAHKLRWR